MTPATQIVRRDLFGYVGLISLVAATPAIDWNGIGGNELSNIARLSYFTVVAIGSVYLGVRRQDIGETAPITGKSAALAPFIATATLGGLYLIIKYTALPFAGCRHVPHVVRTANEHRAGPPTAL